jgi:hypothetical protein
MMTDRAIIAGGGLFRSLLSSASILPIVESPS